MFFDNPNERPKKQLAYVRGDALMLDGIIRDPVYVFHYADRDNIVQGRGRDARTEGRNASY